MRAIEVQYEVPRESRLDRFAVYSREEAVSATVCESFVRCSGDEPTFYGALQASLESKGCAFSEVGEPGSRV